MKEPFTLTRNEKQIRGDVYLSDLNDTSTKKPVVIICHGFKGFKDWGMFPRAAGYLAQQGYVVITFNFSGNGIGEDMESFTELEAFGHNTYGQEQDDLAFLIGKVKQGGVPFSDHMDESKIALIGHSKGGGAAIMYASSHPEEINALVTWNGIANVDIFGQEVREQIKENGVGYVENARTKQKMPIYPIVIEEIDSHKDEYDLPARVALLKQPILLVQARNDMERIVTGASKLIEQAKQGRLIWIEEAGHTFNTTHPYKDDPPAFAGALAVTLAFLKEKLK